MDGQSREMPAAEIKARPLVDQLKSQISERAEKHITAGGVVDQHTFYQRPPGFVGNKEQVDVIVKEKGKPEVRDEGCNSGEQHPRDGEPATSKTQPNRGSSWLQYGFDERTAKTKEGDRAYV
jgi:hypothetical protein